MTSKIIPNFLDSGQIGVDNGERAFIRTACMTRDTLFKEKTRLIPRGVPGELNCSNHGQAFGSTKRPAHQKPKRAGEQSKGVQRKDDEERYQCKRPDLETILREIKRGVVSADTPIITDIVQQGNLFCAKIPNPLVLQQFAEDMKGNKTFEMLKSRRIRLQPSKGLKRDQTVESEKKTRREIQKRIGANVVLKVFLNRCDYATDQFVSVCLFVVNRNEEEQKQDVRQNIPEKGWLIVSLYLKHPGTDENAYRGDFRIYFSPAVEKIEKGLMKFIDKRDFEKYIAKDGSAVIGVLFFFDHSTLTIATTILQTVLIVESTRVGKIEQT
ncbi:uncharacterized protein LOC142356366 isoform X2 [Convolutriloba macropyga]